MGEFELIINQIHKKYNTKKNKMKAYAKRVWELIQNFISSNILFVPRDKNKKFIHW